MMYTTYDVKKISMNDVDKCVNVHFTDGKEYSVPYSFIIDDLVDHVNITNGQEEWVVYTRE